MDSQLVEQIDKILSRDDLYHMLYLKPFECMLDVSKDTLPVGLKIVNRTSENQFQAPHLQPVLSNQEFYKLKNGKANNQNMTKTEIQSLSQYPTYLSYIKKNNADNMLSQMKAQGQMEMAICICMYNENRAMLQHTLMGVAQNIVNLAQQGVDPDKIIVVIVSDGIEKINPDILPLFEIFEEESGIFFENQSEMTPQKLMQKVKRTQDLIQRYGWEGEENIIEISQFLFSVEQLEKRKSLRFVNVKKEYDQVKILRDQVIALQKNKNITYQDLPLRALEQFKRQCKAQITGEPISGKENAYELEKYFNQIKDNLSRSKPIIQNALTKTLSYCRQYIDSRLNLCHTSFFRTSQFFQKDELEQILQEEGSSIVMKKTNQTNKKEKEMKSMSKIDQGKNQIKMNIFFCVKYGNNQKLSSHNWFFNGFCKELSDCVLKTNDSGLRKPFINKISPRFTILLDVGLRPGPDALVKMYNAMNNNNQIGGVCGYMGLKLEKVETSQAIPSQNLDFITNLCLLFVDIQRAQQLQYHFAHLIDKGFESIFRFIHVLPGAFSGYSMEAIWGQDFQTYKSQDPRRTQRDFLNLQKDSDNLLKAYFKSINEKVKNQPPSKLQLSLVKILGRIILPNRLMAYLDPVGQNSIEALMYDSNVYLAEDRILCLGIYQNIKSLLFLPDAYSFVDPVKDIATLMGQRKRWINGSYFAFEKVSATFAKIGCCQGSLFLGLQMEYLGLMNLLAYIAPGFFIFTISVAMQAFKADVLVVWFKDSLSDDSQLYSIFVYTINFAYALLILGLIFYSMNLTNKNPKLIRFAYSTSTFLGLMSCIIMAILIVDLVRGLGQSKSYLISNSSPKFIESIPGGQSTVDILRYIVMGIVGLYAVPVLFYSLIFCNFRVIPQIIGGVISFIFYTPTYLIILSIYALCRMDDLSWGTKGLDDGKDSQNKQILKSWKIIKTIHVGKLIFWNVIVGGLLIHFGSDYLVRFYLTFAIMVIIGSTMFIKVFFALIYYIIYRCKCWVDTRPKQGTTQYQQKQFLCLGNNFKGQYSLEKQLRQSIAANILQPEVNTLYHKHISQIIKNSTIQKKGNKFGITNTLASNDNKNKLLPPVKPFNNGQRKIESPDKLKKQGQGKTNQFQSPSPAKQESDSSLLSQPPRETSLKKFKMNREGQSLNKKSSEKKKDKSSNPLKGFF